MKNIAVIGGGLSGVTCAYYLDKLANIKFKKINIDILEKNSDLSKSKIQNFQCNQEIYDNGWHNSIKSNGILFQMILELGLYRYLIESKKTIKMFYDGKNLKSMPEKILFGYPLDKWELLASDIFNIKEKLSIFFKLHKNSELYNVSKITVEDFFLSKINESVYNKLIEPLLTSYYGSDISNQSFSLLMSELAFATIKNNDVENVVAEMYKNKVEDNILYGKEYRLKFTLRSLVESLESHFSKNVFTEFDSEVKEIEKCGDGYYVTFGEKKRYYDYLIISNKHIDFLDWFSYDKRLKLYYNDLKFNSNLVLTFIIKKDSLNINNELGEIIFSNDTDSCISKIEYVSNKWVDIKSQNIQLLRVYINKQKKVLELIDKEDSEIEDIVLKDILKIHNNIVVEKCYITKLKNNYIKADVKYGKYIDEIDRYLVKNYDKIYFIGHSKKAIDIEHTILESREAARNIIEKL